MLVRFYAIEWAEESETLPTSITLEVDDDIDANEIEMSGDEILEEEYGVAVDSYEWEYAEDTTEDPFSFTDKMVDD